MSWLGEHLNSITGKLSDFTKVLNDNSENLLSGGNEDISLSSYQPEVLLQLCKEKDSQIEQLLAEKDTFEKNIEELDEQHQEAINELLSLKCELFKENNELKSRIQKQNERFKTKISTEANMGIDDDISIDYSERFNMDEPDAFHEVLNFEQSLMNINLLTVLAPLKKCSGDNVLSQQILGLENAKLLLETENKQTGTGSSDYVHKINNYITYLKCICDHSQQLLPVIQETADMIQRFHLDNLNLRKNVSVLENEKNSFVKLHNNRTENENTQARSITECNKSDVNVQTDSSPQAINSEPQYSQTDPECSNADNTKLIDELQFDNCVLKQKLLSLQNQLDKCNATEKKHSVLSQTERLLNFDSRYSQTESKYECNKCSVFLNCVELNDKLQSEIETLKQQICLLEQEVNFSKSNFKESSVFASVQTDEISCQNCEVSVPKFLNELKIAEKALKEKAAALNLLEENHSLFVQKFQDEVKQKEKFIASKEQHISIQNDEIKSLKLRIDNLKDELNQASRNQNSCSSNIDFNKKLENGNDNFSQPMLMCDSRLLPVHTEKEQLIMSVSDNEKLLLREKLKTLDFEKSKLLCVLNEKTQECSGLKAEIHRLTNIVASEKQALFKLQRDNQDLKQVQKSTLDPELTKETVQNLSRLIRDKDIEIEALKQKNNSLSVVIQQSSSAPEHMQSLMEEQANLLKQINVYKSDREKIMISYNTKDQACRQYLADIKKLNALLASQSEKYDVLEQQHHSVAQQYEEKQKSLVNTQNELIALKQRVTDLEQQQIDIKEQYSQLLNKINTDCMISISKDEFHSKVNEIENLRSAAKDNGNLIHEKDCIIHELSQQVKSSKLNLEQQETDILDLKKEKQELLQKLNENECIIHKSHEDGEVLSQRLNDKQSEMSLLREMNERLNMTLKEKEFAIKSMGDKILNLSQVIHGNASSSGALDVDQILMESEAMYSKAQRFHRERDETLLSLSQSQQENQALKSDVQKLRSNEEHLKHELDRLRRHLLQIEENYTNDALKAEEREKVLRNELADVEKTAKVSTSAVLDASHQANIQVASLQEQVVMLANQRDRALAQSSGLDDKVQQYAASLNNLQLVLEQMQKGHEQKIQDMERKFQGQVKKSKLLSSDLETKLEMKQMQLEESSQALEAASRLSEQLDAKEEIIAHLKHQLSKTENLVRSTALEIDSIKSNSEGKVDRVVMKSLVLGYFSTPAGQKSEVVRLLARVLDFSQDEMEKAGIVVSRNSAILEPRGLFSSFFGRLPSLSNSNKPSDEHRQNQKSFTTLFVQFLESESQPIVPMPFPAEKMALELTSKANSSKHSQQTRPAPLNTSPLLLNIATAFPTFTPVPAVEYTSSPAPTILQEVLE